MRQSICLKLQLLALSFSNYSQAQDTSVLVQETDSSHVLSGANVVELTEEEFKELQELEENNSVGIKRHILNGLFFTVYSASLAVRYKEKIELLQIVLLKGKNNKLRFIAFKVGPRVNIISAALVGGLNIGEAIHKIDKRYWNGVVDTTVGDSIGPVVDYGKDVVVPLTEGNLSQSAQNASVPLLLTVTNPSRLFYFIKPKTNSSDGQN